MGLFALRRLLGQPGPAPNPGLRLTLRPTDAEFVDLSTQLVDFDPQHVITTTVTGGIKFRVGGFRYCDSSSSFTVRPGEVDEEVIVGHHWSRRDLLDAAWVESTALSDGACSVLFEGTDTLGAPISFTLNVTISSTYAPRWKLGEMTRALMGGYPLEDFLPGTWSNWEIASQKTGAGVDVTGFVIQNSNKRIVLDGVYPNVPDMVPVVGDGSYVLEMENVTDGFTATVYVDVIARKWDIAPNPTLDADTGCPADTTTNDNVSFNQYARLIKNSTWIKTGDTIAPRGSFNPTNASCILLIGAFSDRSGGPTKPTTPYDPATTNAVACGMDASLEGIWPLGRPTPHEGWITIKPDKPFAGDLGPHQLRIDLMSAAGYAPYIRWSWLSQTRGAPTVNNPGASPNGIDGSAANGQVNWIMIDHCRAPLINWTNGKDYSQYKFIRDNYLAEGTCTIQVAARRFQVVGNEAVDAAINSTQGDWCNFTGYDLADDGWSHVSCNTVIGLGYFPGAHNDLYQWRMEYGNPDGSGTINAPYYRNLAAGTTIYMPRMYMNVSLKGEGRIISQDDIDDRVDYLGGGAGIPIQTELGQSLGDCQGFFLNANTRTDVYYLERLCGNITSNTQFSASSNPAEWADGSFKTHNLFTCEFGIARDEDKGTGYNAAGHWRWGSLCGDPYNTWTGTTWNSTMVVGYNVFNNAGADGPSGVTNSNNRNFSCVGNVWPPTAMVSAYRDPAVGSEVGDLMEALYKLEPKVGSVLLSYSKPQGPIGDKDVIDIAERFIHEPSAKAA